MLAGLIGSGISAGLNLFGAKQSRKHAEKMAARSEALSREFAQSGIQWRVADAKAAGIHPLAALGANTHTPSFAAMGVDTSGYGAAGQDISRAMQTAAQSPSKKQQLYRAKVMELDLRNRELQNDYLASQIAKNNQAGQTPRTGISDGPMLVDGQPDAGGLPLPGGRVLTRPMRREAPHSDRKYQEAGAHTDLGYARTKAGYAPTMSRDTKERLDDDLPGVIWWNIRNRILPALGINSNKPPVRPKKGYRWYYNIGTGEYRQIRKSGKKRPWHYYRR